MALKSANDPKPLLLVEGRDDAHVIKALAKRYGLVNEELKEICSIKDFNQEDGGISLLLEELSVALKGSYKTIAVVVDADTDIEKRWQQIRSLLSKNATVVPEKPLPQGTTVDVIVNEQSTKTIRVGLWIMPNNRLPGMLEDFLQMLIADTSADQPMKTFAEQTFENMIAKKIHRFDEKLHWSKAFIHTWLAWQKDPGKPMGLAVTMKYFDANQPVAQGFIDWLKQLCNIP